MYNIIERKQRIWTMAVEQNIIRIMKNIKSGESSTMFRIKKN